MKVSMTAKEVGKAIEHYARCVYGFYVVENSISLSHYAADYCTFEVDDGAVPPAHADEPTV